MPQPKTAPGGYKRGIAIAQDKSVEEIAAFVKASDRMMGLKMEMDYAGSDAFQYSITCEAIEDEVMR